jgi:FixJ family two-component response regulator
MIAPQEIVYVVDDDGSVRNATIRLLRSAGWRTECFSTAADFAQFVRPDLPSCLVLDVQMPGLTGLDLQQELLRAERELPIVFITGYGDIPMSVRAMKAGAVDFLPKPYDGEALIAAVRQGLERDARKRSTLTESTELHRRERTLSPRERQVFSLVVEGLLNKQIGGRLGVTEKTVKVHRGHLMRKMGAVSLAQLVRMAETLDRSSSR